jgi:hypothetical protein
MIKQLTLRISALVVVVLTVAAPSFGQQPASANGRIVGRVLDAQTGHGLSAVTVQVAGTSIGTISGVGGQFIIGNVPSGAVTLTVSSLGYASKSVSGVVVEAGDVVEQNISLETEAVAIDAIEVTAAAERGSVNRALDQQRTATNIVNAVTSEQITRSPDSDAAQAVQRVSGVTVQDGKFVVVRGLGERYTTTSLNGARIPSPEPEKKMVPLDLFPSGLLEAITTSKTFTPEQPGDFSGAQVDIKTREFPARRRQTLSISLGANEAVTGRSVVGPNRLGAEWLGFGGDRRRMSERLVNAGSFEQFYSQEEVNGLIRSLNNNWSGRSGAGRPNTSVSASIGGNEPIAGQRIGYVLSGTYTLGQEIRENEARALAFPGDDGATSEIDRFAGSTVRDGVLWGGIANFSTLIGSSSRLALNTNYNRSADNEIRNEAGISDDDGFPLAITRLRYIERSVASGQLLGEHEFARNYRFDWSATASHVTRDEPDRAEFVYEMQEDPITGQLMAPAWFAGANEGAVRTFSDLTETAYEAKANLGRTYGFANREHSIRIGMLARATDRDADSRAFSITAPTLSREQRTRPAEEVIAEFSTPGSEVLRLTPLLQGGAYTASDRLLAGYTQFEFQASERLRIITGARIEHSEVEVFANPTVGDAVRVTPAYTDVLPALTFNYALTERQSVRLSASQTLSRPEYRELAPIAYRDVIGGDNLMGNADLRRTLVRNFDVRWEMYPAAGEVLSLGVFAKSFTDPIERVYLGTSGTRVVTFVNAEAASNFGVELELRKGLGMISEWLNPITISTNLTLMHSDIRLQGGGKFLDERSMVGQAPYVINAALTYASPQGGTSATILYNVVGKRIYSAAEAPLPDVYEQPRHVLDFSLRFPLTSGASMKFDLKNLLDSPYEVTQGTAIRESYNVGRVASIGLSWQP